MYRFDTEKINELNQTDHPLCMKQELENSKTVGIKLSLRGWQRQRKLLTQYENMAERQ